MARDYGAEIDDLKSQLAEIQEQVAQFTNHFSIKKEDTSEKASGMLLTERHTVQGKTGGIFFSGHYHDGEWRYRWEPQERPVEELLESNSDKVSRILSALGHKQRIDILRTVLLEPLTGAELVDRLNMGTTGQLYHHMKALQGAGLLAQEERGGRYAFPGKRALPFLLLLAAASELLDASDYLALAEARDHAAEYLGTSQEDYNPHLLLQCVLENIILEHQAGYCSDATVVFHGDGSVTVADNGRGIPIQAFQNSDKPRVQAVLTELHLRSGASFHAPNSAKGISIPIVNALSERLTVEVRREGRMFRQDYKHGIPQTPLLTVGRTNETGTSLTFLPDKKIFTLDFDKSRFSDELAKIAEDLPNLEIRLLTDSDEPQM